MVGQGLATREAQDVAREIQDELQARDVQGLAFIAFFSGTGVVLAQEISERVLPLLNMPSQPTNMTEFLASAGVKLVYALVVGVIAANMSGIALFALAFHALGSVVFAGADLLNAIQRSGFLSENTSFSANFGSGGRSRGRRSPARKSRNGGNNTGSGSSGNGSRNAANVTV